MNATWFALVGVAVGFIAAIAVQVMRERADRNAANDLFQRTTLLELQEVSSEFLMAMNRVVRGTAQGSDSPPDFDPVAAQDEARVLLRRIRILASRSRDRTVETMAAEVFHQAYAAQVNEGSLTSAGTAWEALNDYIGTLIR